MTTIATPLDRDHRSITISLLAAVALMSYANLSVSAALPEIGDDLGRVELLPWLITVELLAAAIAVLAVGPVVDGFGVRPVFRLSVLAFVVASIACALAPSMAVLVAGRVAQGLAAGGVLASAFATIGLAYDPLLRPKVYAINSALWGVMGVGGPGLAAVLVSVAGWRAVFAVAVPIGLGAVVVGWRHLPGRPAEADRTDFDLRGLALIAVVTIALLFAASASSAWSLAWFAPAVVAVVLYRRHARGHTDPVVRLDHLTAAQWRNLHLPATLVVAGGTGAAAFLPVYVRAARDGSAATAAFSVFFLSVGWSVAAWVSSRLQQRHHPARVVLWGTRLLVISVGTAAGAAAVAAPLAVLLVAFIGAGGGIGLSTTATLNLLQSRARPEEMGRISSAHQFVRSLGFTYGAAVAGGVLLLVVRVRVGEVESVRRLLGGESEAAEPGVVDALADGYALAVAAMAVVSIGALVTARRLHATRTADWAQVAAD
ncbi:MAG: MFS transporter [Actinomycetota bacterium]